MSGGGLAGERWQTQSPQTSVCARVGVRVGGDGVERRVREEACAASAREGRCVCVCVATAEERECVSVFYFCTRKASKLRAVGKCGVCGEFARGNGCVCVRVGVRVGVCGEFARGKVCVCVCCGWRERVCVSVFVLLY